MSNSTISYNSDEDLSNALQNADQNALKVVYDRYSGILFSVLKKMTGDTVTAEKILESCFVHVWRTRHSYNPSKEKLFLWIFQIAINTANSNNDSTHRDWRNAGLLMEPILLGYISQQEATERMGISIEELRQMIRTELNQSRGN